MVQRTSRTDSMILDHQPTPSRIRRWHGTCADDRRSIFPRARSSELPVGLAEWPDPSVQRDMLFALGCAVDTIAVDLLGLLVCDRPLIGMNQAPLGTERMFCGSDAARLGPPSIWSWTTAHVVHRNEIVFFLHEISARTRTNSCSPSRKAGKLASSCRTAEG